MLKLLKLLVALVVFAFVFVGAFFGFKIYMEVQALKAAPQGGAASTSAEARGGDLGSIVADYRKSSEAAGKMGQAAEIAPGEIAAAVATPVKPVPTPDGSQKVIREYAAGRK